jgi:hypothetical protein
MMVMVIMYISVAPLWKSHPRISTQKDRPWIDSVAILGKDRRSHNVCRREVEEGRRRGAYIHVVVLKMTEY